MTTDQHIDLEQEQGALGAVLLVPESQKMMERLLADVRLAPEHFYKLYHSRIWWAMTQLYDSDQPIDPTTVAAQLERDGYEADRAYLHTLATVTPQVSAYQSYGQRVVELAERRALGETLRQMCEAYEQNDMESFRRAEVFLTPEERRSDTTTPQQFAELALSYLERGGDVVYPLPWHRLTSFLAGGLRPATVTLVGGYTNHGKSFLADQILEHATKHGASAHVYMNEMSQEDRALRAAARITGTPLSSLLQKDLTDEQWQRLARLGERMPYGATTITDWTAEEVARDIRRKRWGICVVDLVHLFPFHEERELAAISASLKHAAIRSGTVLLEVVHLNRRGFVGSYPRQPSIGDVRWSGSLAENADNVLLLYREEARTDDGQPMNTQGEDAVIDLAKAKNGRLGQMRVKFNEYRCQFDLPIGEDGQPAYTTGSA